MSRALTEAMALALQSSNVAVALLLEGEYASGTVRTWTGLGTLSWGGHDWTGLGQLIGIGPIEETDRPEARGLAVTLRGVKPADVSLALNEFRLNKAGSIRLALFDSDLILGGGEAGEILGEPWTEYEFGEGADLIGDAGWVFGESTAEFAFGVSGGGIIADPKIIFRGRLDVGGIDDQNPEEPTLFINYENELIDLERAQEWRFTDQHQKQLYPSDRAFEFVAGLVDAEVIWGRR